MPTNKQRTEAQEYISGSCMVSPEQAIATILERDPTEKELDEFNKFLEDAEVFECEQCGWTTYPGEGDGTLCDECLSDQDEDEDD